MKSVLIAFLFSILPVILYGQSLAVSAEKMNIVYVGVDNPLTIVAEGYRCDQLQVSCENCEITKKENCSYNLHVAREGTIEVDVKVKSASGLKVVGARKFRCKLIPLPRATILGRSSGTVSASSFKVQLGIVAFVDGFDFEAQFTVSSFKIAFLRENTLLFSGLNVGPRFNQTVRGSMESLKPGDRVFITEIKVLGPDRLTRAVNDINLTLN